MKKPSLSLPFLYVTGFLAIAGLTLSFIETTSATPPSGTEPGNPKLRDSVIVRTAHPAALRQSVHDRGLKLLSNTQLPNGDTLVLVEGKVTDQKIQRLSQQAKNLMIGEIAPNHRYQLTTTPNDTYYPNQWGLAKISAPYAWNLTKGSSAVKIAVLDTGILSSQQWGAQGPYTHADFPSEKIWTNMGEKGATVTEGLAPNCTSRGLLLDKQCNNFDDDANGFIDDWRGWDFIGGWRGGTVTCPNYTDPSTYNDAAYPDYVMQDSDPQPYSCDDYNNPSQLNKDHYDGGCNFGVGACYIGHGTSVASVAAAATNNSSVVAGIDWDAQLMNVRVMDGYGTSTTAIILAGIEYAITMDADVINMSLAIFTNGGCTTTDSSVENALMRAKAAGITVVAASGNGGNSGVCYPARSPYAIAVGASDQNDRRSSFSTYGPELDVLAPGTSIFAANAPSKARNTDYHPSANGTSLATPHVAGLAASIKAAHPGISVDAVQDFILSNTDKLTDMSGAHKTDQHGYGRINNFSSIADLGNKIPVYRLYNPHAGTHFFTTSAGERDYTVIQLGFKYEGVAFHARNNEKETQPVYRLYRGSTRSHLFTTSTIERDTAVTHAGFRYEGVGWYLLQNHDSIKQPIYRVYRHSSGNHLWTASAGERDYVVGNLGFTHEGTGFSSE